MRDSLAWGIVCRLLRRLWGNWRVPTMHWGSSSHHLVKASAGVGCKGRSSGSVGQKTLTTENIGSGYGGFNGGGQICRRVFDLVRCEDGGWGEEDVVAADTIDAALHGVGQDA